MACGLLGSTARYTHLSRIDLVTTEGVFVSTHLGCVGCVAWCCRELLRQSNDDLQILRSSASVGHVTLNVGSSAEASTASDQEAYHRKGLLW